MPLALIRLLIGRNGSGKSTFLNLIRGALLPTIGTIRACSYLRIGYVPQNCDIPGVSGGNSFWIFLTKAIALQPDLLILDEPTNHLDKDHRTSFMKFLNTYKGTLLTATHDRNLLNSHFKNFWHIEEGKIHIFSG